MMDRKALGPVLTTGQLSRLRTIVHQANTSGSLLDLARKEVIDLLKDIDAENGETEVLFRRKALQGK